MLAPFDRVSDDRHAISAVTHMLSTVLAENDVVDALTTGLADTYPWVEFLPLQERRRFGAELMSTLRACASIGRFAGYENFVSLWAATVEIWSDPDLVRALSHPVDVPDGTTVLEPATA